MAYSLGLRKMKSLPVGVLGPTGAPPARLDALQLTGARLSLNHASEKFMLSHQDSSSHRGQKPRLTTGRSHKRGSSEASERMLAHRQQVASSTLWQHGGEQRSQSVRELVTNILNSVMRKSPDADISNSRKLSDFSSTSTCTDDGSKSRKPADWANRDHYSHLTRTKKSCKKHSQKKKNEVRESREAIQTLQEVPVTNYVKLDSHSTNRVKDDSGIRRTRLIKVYQSERQSGQVCDMGVSMLAAPPTTPLPDILATYDYIASMSDIRAQRAVRGQLELLLQQEKKRDEKEQEERTHQEKLRKRELDRQHRIRQRMEIYALNKVMTELENSNFEVFCKQNGIEC